MRIDNRAERYPLSAPSTSTPTASPTARSTPTTIDVCALVNQEDAQTLAETPLNPGQAGNPNNPSCTYNGPVSGPVARVQVYVGDGAKKALDIDRMLGHMFTAVSGMGDEAYEEADNIYLRKSTAWVWIHLVLLNDPAQNRLPLERLATKVAAQLVALGL